VRVETLEVRQLMSAGPIDAPSVPAAQPAALFSPRRPPKPPAPPVAPGFADAFDLSASAARVTWTDRSANEQGFRVEAAPRGGKFAEVATAGAGSTAAVVEELTGDTSYTFRVAALGSGGTRSDFARTAHLVSLNAEAETPDPFDTPGWFRFTLGGQNGVAVAPTPSTERVYTADSGSALTAGTG
jgi:hypothetical protein